MPEFCLLDNALAGQDFLDDISKKPEWYDKVKDLHGLWEGAWADGSFFSLKWGEIWVILEKKGKNHDRFSRHRVLASPQRSAGFTAETGRLRLFAKKVFFSGLLWLHHLISL